MKKALMTASVASMLDNFNRGNIDMLLKMDYDVTLAANFSGEEDSSPSAKLRHFQAEMEAKGCRVIQIDFSRKIGNLLKQLKSYRQLRELAKEGFDLVHCNSPICAVLTRLAFRKNRMRYGTRVIYTAHGFHFFRGAPVRNWLLYFPVEWVCAHWTDILNTVNEEDYRFAKRWLKAGKVVRLPGVGIDLEKFRPKSEDSTAVRDAVRRELGLAPDEKMLLSVGELNRNKNHATVIWALGVLQDPSIRYCLCGKGILEPELKELVKELRLDEQVRFLGYREDIAVIYQAADLFVFPSLREGMPMALMEAMAAKIPVICSDIRGNRELVRERKLRFHPKAVKDIAECIRRGLEEDQTEHVERHYKRVNYYRSEIVEKIMRNEYRMTAG